MIFTITPLTNWGPIVLALAGGAQSSLVADQVKNRVEKKNRKKVLHLLGWKNQKVMKAQNNVNKHQILLLQTEVY